MQQTFLVGNRLADRRRCAAGPGEGAGEAGKPPGSDEAREPPGSDDTGATLPFLAGDDLEAVLSEELVFP